METIGLLEKYLKEQTSYMDIVINEYELDGSNIRLIYSYNPKFDWNKDYISFGNRMEIDLLTYITWVYNHCIGKKII